MSRYVKICQDMSRYVKICQDMSRYVNMIVKAMYRYVRESCLESTSAMMDRMQPPSFLAFWRFPLSGTQNSRRICRSETRISVQLWKKCQGPKETELVELVRHDPTARWSKGLITQFCKCLHTGASAVSQLLKKLQENHFLFWRNIASHLPHGVIMHRLGMAYESRYILHLSGCGIAVALHNTHQGMETQLPYLLPRCMFCASHGLI